MRVGEFVICRLRCAACFVWSAFSLPAEEKARKVLDELGCPFCGRRGQMRFAPLARGTKDRAA